MGSTTKSFEELYYEAPSFWQPGAVTTGRLREIGAMLPAGTDTLLDVGCGNGAFGHHLMEERPEIAVTGVDRSEAALSHVRFAKHQAAIDSLPFDDRSFSAVSCLQVLEHLDTPTSRAAIGELARVSRDAIVVEVPYCEDIAANRTRCPRCRCEFNIDLHLDSFDDARLSRLFDGHGFHFVRMAYPDRKEHLVAIDAALAGLQAMRTRRPEFLSPICPLCGYSEGDRTASSLLAPPAAGNPSPARGAMRRGVGNLLRRHWPKVTVRGYSAACLYQRGG